MIKLIDVTIKNPKSRKEEQDAVSVASQSSDKGKKRGKKLSEKLKKVKKVKCFNCKKIGHFTRDCYAKDGRAEGKGPKQKGQEKGKEKELAVKVEEKDSEDHGMWMVSVGGNDEVQD
jgi:Zinc knuckle